MEANPSAELDAWLCLGGLVVTASDRAARAVLGAYHDARRAEGLKAWVAPNVLDWQSFALRAWEEGSHDKHLVLNAIQEQHIWAGIAGDSGLPAAVLDRPRRRLSGMAMDAHSLLCSYAPRFLDARARTAWQQDAATFSGWLTDFEERCRDLGCVSASRVPLEAIQTLSVETQSRPPLLIYGFDRLTPLQRELFDAWGDWQQVSGGRTADELDFYAADDDAAELKACAAWCKQRLAAQPDTRLLVVAKDGSLRRGEIERAFLPTGGNGSPLRFVFSLGVPLGAVAIARSAHLMLRWLNGPLEEHEMDWLFSSGYGAATAHESAALQAAMRSLRNRSRQRPAWTLRAFLNECSAASLLDSWVQRMSAAQLRLRSAAQRQAGSMEWAELASHLLEKMAWQQARTPSSPEFQATRRWQQLLEECGSLGFDGRRTQWKDFAAELHSALEDTLFAPESDGTDVVIAGPAESAGLNADGIWFLGADEHAWPARADLHPLLPPDVQRDAGMPHASPQLDWDVAHAMTARILASAPQVIFSFARQVDGVDARPSRLVSQVAGPAKCMAAGLLAGVPASPLAVRVEDPGRIPFPRIEPVDAAVDEAGGSAYVRGGSSVLTAQSQCPFKAFAGVRLCAKEWDPGESALTPPERGQLMHAVLHRVWGGKPAGIRSLDELRSIADLPAFVAGHVREVIMNNAPQRVLEPASRRYLELEARRLTQLVTEWLRYEATRAPFTVLHTELKQRTTVAGLALDLRLDRLDRLSDGTVLVIDYKTGNVSPRAWEPRMDDVQLPLYARFGLAGQALGGLVFAKVRPGDMCFTGRVADAQSTLDPSLGRTSSMVRKPMDAAELMDWEDAIVDLAHGFLAGDAAVDPRDPPNTCKACGLHTLCRIKESELAAFGEDTESEADDE